MELWPSNFLTCLILIKASHSERKQFQSICGSVELQRKNYQEKLPSKSPALLGLMRTFQNGCNEIHTTSDSEVIVYPCFYAVSLEILLFLEEFKTKFKNRVPQSYPCCLCKTNIQNVGFI